MPSPVAHSLVGLAIGRVFEPEEPHRPWLWFGVAVLSANAADLDFAAGLVSHGINDLHRGPSHSFAAAVIYGAVVAALLWPLGFAYLRTFSVTALVYASHVVLDVFSGEARAGDGLMMFWPLSTDRYMSPVPIFNGIRHGGEGDSLATFLSELTSHHNVVELQLELAVALPSLIIAYYYFRCPLRAPLGPSAQES